MSKRAMMKPMYIAVIAVIAIVFLSTVGSLLKLLSDVKAYQKYWDDQNAAIRSASALQYIALGDSTAQGLGATRPQKGYVSLVANELARRTDREVQVYNISRSGAKIRDVIDRQLPLLFDQVADSTTVITVAIGANDMGSYDEQVFASEVDELFSQLPKHTIVSDIAYFGSGRYRHLERDVVATNEVFATTSQKYGLKMAHLHEFTLSRDHFGVHSIDFLHPSNQGYRNWAAAFIEQLDH